MATISTKDIAQAIYASAKDKSDAELDAVVKNAVAFLVHKNFLSKASDVLRHLEHLIDQADNVLRTTVLSAQPLTKKVTDEIERMLKKRHDNMSPLLEWKEDKTLIGGVRIETEDEVIDLTLKNKLNQLQAYLSQN